MAGLLLRLILCSCTICTCVKVDHGWAMWGEARVNTAGCSSWRPPNHTGWSMAQSAWDLSDICIRTCFSWRSSSRYPFFNACTLQSNNSCKHHKRLTLHFHMKENVISQVKSKPSIGLQVSVLCSSAWRDDN